MLDAITKLCLTVGDLLLGWSLHLPRFVTLLILAVATALLLTLIRKGTTNQDRLRRAKADKKRLKTLVREAKKAGDSDAVKRYRATLGEIGMVNLKSELRPLLVSLVPIALLGLWAFFRIGYLPLRADAPIAVRTYFTTSEIGNLVHIVPPKGLQAPGGWIQQVAEDKDKDGQVSGGVATWTLACTDGGGSFVLPIRYKGARFDKDLLVDGHRYADPVHYYTDDSVLASEVAMTEYRPLDLVPGFPAIGFPPWLVGYLIIVIPLSLLMKPVLRIH